MHEGYDAFEQRGVPVILVAQEDDDLAKHARMFSSFDPAPRFDVVADLERQVTTRWDRATIYAIDAEGVVQQVFPQLLHYRASWGAIAVDLRIHKRERK